MGCGQTDCVGGDEWSKGVWVVIRSSVEADVLVLDTLEIARERYVVARSLKS